MAAAPTTTAETREEKVARYIELDALAHLIRGGGFDLFDGLFAAVDHGRVAESVGAADLFDELWPDEDGPFGFNGPEAKLAEARSVLLAAQLTERISTNAHKLASFYRGWAAMQVGDVRGTLTAALEPEARPDAPSAADAPENGGETR